MLQGCSKLVIVNCDSPYQWKLIWSVTRQLVSKNAESKLFHIHFYAVCRAGTEQTRIRRNFHKQIAGSEHKQRIFWFFQMFGYSIALLNARHYLPSDIISHTEKKNTSVINIFLNKAVGLPDQFIEPHEPAIFNLKYNVIESVLFVSATLQINKQYQFVSQKLHKVVPTKKVINPRHETMKINSYVNGRQDEFA